jgi:sugar/nucleoside kinase (ribokinase family)
LEQITEELISQCRVLFIEHHVPATGLLAAKIARACAIPVVADVESNDFPELGAFLQAADHLIVGKALAGKLTGKSRSEAMVLALSGSGRTCTVVTDGASGCWFVERGGEARHIAGHAVKVVDTTGCGDVFHGAYAAAIARGEGPARAAELANATAAIKATQAGGRSGIPDLKTVEAFLRGRPR